MLLVSTATWVKIKLILILNKVCILLVQSLQLASACE